MHSNLFTPVAVSDIQDLPTLAALFKADSNYGLWPEPVSAEDNKLIVGDRIIPYFLTNESSAQLGRAGRRRGDRLHRPRHEAGRRAGPPGQGRQARAR